MKSPPSSSSSSLLPVLCAQSTQTPAGSQASAERRRQMTEMHKQQVEAMKADVAKMKVPSPR
jgi:hypothetical protein